MTQVQLTIQSAIAAVLGCKPESVPLERDWMDHWHPVFVICGFTRYTAFPDYQQPTDVAENRAKWWLPMGQFNGLIVYQSVPCI